MLRKVLSVVVEKLKGYTMAEAATCLPNVPGEKRPLEEEKGETQTEENVAKKARNEPMQGRLDRKRKCALLLAYCGAGYYGIQIQRNENFKTIESELIKALLAAGVITEEDAESPKKMFFQRAARTDKNVSAVGNVISLKMLYDDHVNEKINTHLPPEIRVITCMRTTKGFDSKNHCTARTYVYMMPTYSFAPVEKFITKDFRVQAEVIERAREVLKKFVGTHNFHNFTSGRKPNDPSSKRYIMSFECSDPFVRDGIEFVTLTVKGQSFMLHHIRKMIGLTISVVRGFCGEDALVKSWGPLKMDIPKAPGLGLFLQLLEYKGYNNKFGKDGIHQPLVWDQFQDALDKFREDFILSHIAQAEAKESVMLQWLVTLQYHKFDVIDPNEEVPPDGEKEKNRNWWRTKMLLQKLDKERQASPPKTAIGSDLSDADKLAETTTPTSTGVTNTEAEETKAEATETETDVDSNAGTNIESNEKNCELEANTETRAGQEIDKESGNNFGDSKDIETIEKEENRTVSQ